MDEEKKKTKNSRSKTRLSEITVSEQCDVVQTSSSIENETDKNKQFVRSSEIQKVFKVNPTTIRRWADDGLVDFIRTPGGTRLYNIKSFTPQNITDDTVFEKPITIKDSYCYCRVSTSGQKEDLQRQIKFMSEGYPTYKIISDIGSGINFKRKGLQTLLDECFKGNVKEVVVAYKDRLCRFGFELLEWIFSKYSVKLMVLNQEISNGPEEDLTRDLLSIINVFSARINGRRKYKTKKIKETEENNKQPEIEKTN